VVKNNSFDREGTQKENRIHMNTNEFEKAKIFSFSESVDYSDGGIVSKTVLKKQTGNISLFSFAKGEALSEHTAPFDAMITVVDGRGEVIIGGKSFLLDAGQSIIMPANITHAVNAVEKFKMVLTMIKSS
jgi:quercetin dioxygenase-like cupin family protein